MRNKIWRLSQKPCEMKKQPLLCSAIRADDAQGYFNLDQLTLAVMLSITRCSSYLVSLFQHESSCEITHECLRTKTRFGTEAQVNSEECK